MPEIKPATAGRRARAPGAGRDRRSRGLPGCGRRGGGGPAGRAGPAASEPGERAGCGLWVGPGDGARAPVGPGWDRGWVEPGAPGGPWRRCREGQARERSRGAGGLRPWESRGRRGRVEPGAAGRAECHCRARGSARVRAAGSGGGAGRGPRAPGELRAGHGRSGRRCQGGWGRARPGCRQGRPSWAESAPGGAGLWAQGVGGPGAPVGLGLWTGAGGPGLCAAAGLAGHQAGGEDLQAFAA